MYQSAGYLKGLAAALLFAAMPAMCADLLVDDFTNPDASHLKWINTDQGTLTHSVAGGSCTLDNSASSSIGEYKHDFGASKPAVFTLSYVLKSVQGSIAGAFFCRQPDSRTGYILTTASQEGSRFVAVYKITVSGTSISAASIFYEKSFDLNPTDNKLTVSKSGSTFHVYANDFFVGGFTDASYNAGDISLVTWNNTKAVFGAVRVTDDFKPGSGRTSFSDNFNGNGLKYWEYLTSVDGPAPTIGEVDGKLKITSRDSGAAWLYVNIADLTDFTARVEVSHISGKLTSPYGFFLIGENASTQMVKFFIMAGRYYAVWKSGAESYTPALSTAIRGSGASSDGSVYIDTLTIRKNANSPTYEFLANGQPLAINLGQVNFSIKAIGLFCENDVTLAFDNFDVKQNNPVSILKDGNKPTSPKPSSVTTRNSVYYDLRGRRRYSAIASTQGNGARVRAAGLYVNKNGREAVAKKGLVTDK